MKKMFSLPTGVCERLADEQNASRLVAGLLEAHYKGEGLFEERKRLASKYAELEKQVREFNHNSALFLNDFRGVLENIKQRSEV